MSRRSRKFGQPASNGPHPKWSRRQHISLFARCYLEERLIEFLKEHSDTLRTPDRVEFAQKIDSFWTPWTRDVFPLLLPRKKWNEEKQNDPVDDCVSANSWWNFWNVGWVISVYPRKETLVRNVKVKTRSGEYDRPITKISVIYRAEGYCDDDERRWKLMPSLGQQVFYCMTVAKKMTFVFISFLLTQ